MGGRGCEVRRPPRLWQVLREPTWNTSLEPCKVSAGHGAVSTAVFPECLQRYQVLCASYFIFVITLEIGDSFTWGTES